MHVKVHERDGSGTVTHIAAGLLSGYSMRKRELQVYLETGPEGTLVVTVDYGRQYLAVTPLSEIVEKKQEAPAP